MNVADEKLCKELYKLSGWFPKPLQYAYYKLDGKEQLLSAIRVSDNEPKFSTLALLAPAYDAGFLLRKLPATRLKLRKFKDGWAAQYNGPGVRNAEYTAEADTPEDALIKLAITLFNQKLIERSE